MKRRPKTARIGYPLGIIFGTVISLASLNSSEELVTGLNM
jgi:hypothetical protein